MAETRKPAPFWGTVVGGAVIMFLLQWGVFGNTPAGAVPATVGMAIALAFLAKLQQTDIG